MSVNLVVRFNAKPDRLADFAGILDSVRHSLPGQGGCRDIRILQSIDDPCEIVLIEAWDSRDQHRDHFASIVENGSWARILSHLAQEPASFYCRPLEDGLSA